MIEQAFTVATEFDFSIGQALLNTKTLSNAVGQLSDQANGALGSLNYLAGGLIARLGFGSGGVLTVMSKAVEIAEAFDTQALSFSNNISTNFSLLSGTIETFNDRLGTSKMILDNISKVAIGNALPTDQLAQIANLIATPLAQHGKLGKNYGGAIEMGKNLMLGSEAVGVHPQVAGESLYRALTDHMALHGALFSRLVNTPTFKQAHLKTQQQLMNMNPDKKIDLLGHALKDLASDSEALSYRMNSLHGQITILKDLFTQMGSMLRPIGEAIRKPIIQLLTMINTYVKENGPKLGQAIGNMLSSALQDPKGLLINIMQISRIGKDFKKALHLTEIYGTWQLISFLLAKIGITLNGGLLRIGLTYLWRGIVAILGIIPFTKLLSGAFTVLGAAFDAFVAPFMAFMFFFQILSRARAIAKVHDAIAWITLLPKLSAMIVRMKGAFENILMPLQMAMDFWANLIAPLFETSFYGGVVVDLLGKLAGAFEFLGHGMILALATVSGLTNALIGMFHGVIPTTKHLGKDFNEGVDTFLERNKARLGGDPSKTTAYQVTNIGKVEMNMDFKEQMEPDRIAFSLKEQLLKVARNPTQGRGSSFQGAFAGATPFAGNR